MRQQRFESDGTEIRFPVCNICRNRTAATKCKAFPDGIPEIILQDENRHTQPLPGQKNDIVFERTK